MAGRVSSFQGLLGRHGAAAGWCLMAVFVGTAAAQPAAKGRPKPNPEVKKLDSKMEKVKDSFLKDTEQLIKSYEDAGSFDRARTILEALQKLYPQNEPIKMKLELLAAQSLDASEIDFDLDAGKSWQEVGPVGKDRTIRIKVSGDYKLTTAPLTTGPDGLVGENPEKDLLPHVPFGAVMGAIIPAAAPAATEKPPKPFLVGSSYERPADRDGVLYMKVNVPPNSKCVGKLQVKVGGTIQP
ncbi:MAG: hypothetical protein NT171_13945 [Planctomycetota bacterium]|nr:hypothetical protein [Planctomycetota bacterium]